MNLPDIVLAHRYRYYCKNAPAISDYEYDKLEARARKEAPAGHPILGPGSDVEEDYPEHIRTITFKALMEATKEAL